MTEANAFVGTWKLISWEVRQPDGKIHNLIVEFFWSDQPMG
jgi:hypothetical protein